MFSKNLIKTSNLFLNVWNRTLSITIWSDRCTTCFILTLTYFHNLPAMPQSACAKPWLDQGHRTLYYASVHTWVTCVAVPLKWEGLLKWTTHMHTCLHNQASSIWLQKKKKKKKKSNGKYHDSSISFLSFIPVQRAITPSHVLIRH